MPQLTPPKKGNFPPIPEFYGGESGPQVSAPATVNNQADWSNAYRQSVPPTKPILDVLMEIADDPRNAWMGLGPAGMAVKGSRLIKPLVAAERSPFAAATLPAKQKSLMHGGSEQAGKILDYDPKLGHTTNPVWGGPHQTADTFTYSGPGLPPTPDEVVAAQGLLKQIAQQNAPKEITLYRGGEPLRHAHLAGQAPRNPNTPVPATTDLNTATNFAIQQYGNAKPAAPLFELKVPREDLLANIEKLQRGRGYRESEYLIPLRSFEGAQTRLPFENPAIRGDETLFRGAKIQAPTNYSGAIPPAWAQQFMFPKKP